MWERVRWLPEYRGPVIVLATMIVCFPVNHYVLSIDNCRRLLARWGADARAREVYGVVLSRVLRMVLYAGVPSLVIGAASLGGTPASYGVSASHLGVSLAVALAAIAVLWPSLWLIGRILPSFYTGYPEIRFARWSRSLALLDLVAWLVYLVAYEFLFRGFLMLSLVPAFGVWPAVLVTSALYIYSHVPKYPPEVVSCLFLAPLFAVATLTTGSIVCPILVHTFFAWYSEVCAVRAGLGAAPSAETSSVSSV